MCQIHNPGMAIPCGCFPCGICGVTNAIARVCLALALQGTKVPTVLVVRYTLS